MGTYDVKMKYIHALLGSKREEKRGEKNRREMECDMHDSENGGID